MHHELMASNRMQILVSIPAHGLRPYMTWTILFRESCRTDEATRTSGAAGTQRRICAEVRIAAREGKWQAEAYRVEG